MKGESPVNETVTIVTKAGAIVRIHPGKRTEEERKKAIEEAAIKFAQHIQKNHPDLFEQLLVR